jgi:ABC-type transport system involved in cytochrome c biogenesis permease subunit
MCSVHASLAFVAYALFLTAGIGSLVYFVVNQSRSLQSLEKFQELAQDVRYKLNQFYIITGLLFLTIAFILGFIQSKKAWGNYFIPEVKIVSSLSIWLYYVVGLAIIFYRNQKSPEKANWRLSILGLSGVLLISVNLVLGNLLFKGLHHFI